MKKIKSFSAIIFILSLIFVYKAASLFLTKVDGDGAALYFFGVEINDRIPTSQIPYYSFALLLIGVVLSALSYVSLLRFKSHKAS